MSLINDALKKAQKQRSQDSAPLFVPSFAKSAVPEKASPPKKSRAVRPLVILGLCAVALSAVSIGTTLFILHSDSSPTPSPTQKPIPAPIVSSAKSIPAQPPTTLAASSSAPAPALLPAAPVALTTSVFVAPTPPPAVSALTPPKAEVPVAATPTTAPTPTGAAAETNAAKPAETEVAFHPRVPETPKATMRIQGVIDKLRVAGIRVSSTESKVILNERLYRLNDVVDPVLGLRLTVVDLHALTFTDEAGATYVKLF